MDLRWWRSKSLCKRGSECHCHMTIGSRACHGMQPLNETLGLWLYITVYFHNSSLDAALLQDMEAISGACRQLCQMLSLLSVQSWSFNMQTFASSQALCSGTSMGMQPNKANLFSAYLSRVRYDILILQLWSVRTCTKNFHLNFRWTFVGEKERSCCPCILPGRWWLPQSCQAEILLCSLTRLLLWVQTLIIAQANYIMFFSISCAAPVSCEVCGCSHLWWIAASSGDSSTGSQSAEIWACRISKQIEINWILYQ